MAFKDTVKPWFRTFLYPTQAQFWQFFDWIIFKDEPISINQITGLQVVLNGLASPLETFVTATADHTYTIPAGYRLEAIVGRPLADCSPYVESEGTVTPGDILPQDDEKVVTPGIGFDLTVSILAISATNIVVKGFPVGSTLVFIKRKIF